MNNLNFFRSLYIRWISASPKHAKLATNILVILGVVVGLPEFLAMFHIEVPLLLAPYVSKIISVAALCLSILAKLTVEDKTPFNNLKPKEDAPENL